MIDNEIYEWLNNNSLNEYTNSNINTTTILIECILIISINGILVERQSLFDYCNNVYYLVLNNNNNNCDDKVIINSNNKRINIEDNEISTSTSYYYGLSEKQFQTIYNNINSINSCNSSINNSTLSTTLNYNNSSEGYISNKIKFNSSITIISENNKRILKQQQQYNSNTNNTATPILSNNNNNNNNSRKKIKGCNCSGNSSNSNSGIDITFFHVWRNIVIRNEILFHARLYNIHLGRNVCLWLNELPTYKYKSYLDKLKILGDGDSKILEQNTLPSNLSRLVIKSHVELQINSIPHSVTSVSFDDFNEIKQTFSKGILHDGITSLKFNDSSKFNQKLSLEWLPSSLKSLTLGRSYQQDIEPNQIPESLTKFVLHSCYKGFIVEGSIPLAAVKSFNYTFDSKENKVGFTNYQIPKSTTSLEFDLWFNKPIKLGDISHNITSIKFSQYFNSDIQFGSLPVSLKSLNLGGSFTKSIGVYVLPSNLKLIDMSGFNHPLIPNLFPQSITSITMKSFNQPIPVGYFYNYMNLKSLEFGELNQDIPKKTLPPTLTSLYLGWKYTKPLKVKSLPKSLLILTLDSNDYQIQDCDKFSSTSITSLTLCTSLPISVGSLPCNLKELTLKDSQFNHDLSADGILPQSLQSIYIHSDNTDLINILDPHFFNKYIKFIK